MPCKIAPELYIAMDSLRFHQRYESISEDRFIKCVGRSRLDVGFWAHVETKFTSDTFS